MNILTMYPVAIRIVLKVKHVIHICRIVNCSQRENDPGTLYNIKNWSILRGDDTKPVTIDEDMF